MKVIFKHPLEDKKKQVVTMTCDVKILCVQVQNNIPCLWAEQGAMSAPKDWTIETIHTGYRFPTIQGVEREYIGTYQLSDYVGHVYLLREIEA